MKIQEMIDWLWGQMEGKPLSEDKDTWKELLGKISRDLYVPVDYKPNGIEYQTEYFRRIREVYYDLSMVIYRGGKAIAIWPLCVMSCENGKLTFGSNGGALLPPFFVNLPKSEAQRKVIQKIIDVLSKILIDEVSFDNRIFIRTIIMDIGVDQWTRKWLEMGAVSHKITWWAYVDLWLSEEDILQRTRRTNKYSIAKESELYYTELYDSDTNDLTGAFESFRKMHIEVAGRETRSFKTWEIQKNAILENGDDNGYDFIILLRDKANDNLVGAAAFESTPQSSVYSVAVYDRTKFDRPVGHLIQMKAMEYMRHRGVRWYTLGERPYTEQTSDLKLINIGVYKEGFSTNMYPRFELIFDLSKIV